MPESLDLSVALGRVRRITGLPVAFGGRVGGNGRHLRLTDFAGTATLALHGLVVSAGNGLGGSVVATAMPNKVEDYPADPRISHEYDAPVCAEGLRAIAAVPVTADSNVLGVLYAGTREPLAVGVRAVDAMRHVAQTVGNEIAVRRQVEWRVAEIEAAAASRRTQAREWEEVRLAHADLRTLAAETTDPVLRERLQRIADRLTGGETPGTNPLSPRERDVLAMVAVGCGNAEAARRLGLLPETVKSYLRSAMRKLGTHGRIETVVTARRLGFLP
ncbi:GAF domain-containing protein [Actinoplanes sp. TBRC 11911]|uniref:helix-turn-helix transcriptional regulator n=1 Tax=Actinoplanes sp. TBRC 11911 TaxID=2729386 RepID=UPI00145D4720|nr:LuxR C-terminal-related transcriptional regulator [Actinoplanes sp. TBRC 11911]NMO53326.1 GAF domain-containing protein [Actinoplanes sp. TBRC 11911]